MKPYRVSCTYRDASIICEDFEDRGEATELFEALGSSCTSEEHGGADRAQFSVHTSGIFYTAIAEFRHEWRGNGCDGYRTFEDRAEKLTLQDWISRNKSVQFRQYMGGAVLVALNDKSDRADEAQLYRLTDFTIGHYSRADQIDLVPRQSVYAGQPAPRIVG